jgi:hypothetical protein
MGGCNWSQTASPNPNHSIDTTGPTQPSGADLSNTSPPPPPSPREPSMHFSRPSGIAAPPAEDAFDHIDGTAALPRPAKQMWMPLPLDVENTTTASSTVLPRSGISPLGSCTSFSPHLSVVSSPRTSILVQRWSHSNATMLQSVE